MTGADPQGLLQQLQTALAAGRLAEAETHCAELCACCPDNAELWATLGRISGQTGHYAEAEHALRNAVELAPDNGESWYLLGALLQARGQPADAIEPLRRALSYQPHRPDALTSLGTALQETGALAEARERYQAALALQPENLAARYNLALVCRDQNQFQDAASHLRLALELAPDNPTVHNSLGYVLRELGDLQGAERHLRQAIEADPTLAEAQYNLGSVLADRLQPVAAESCLRKAVEFKPELADAHRSLGNALLAQGREEEAERCYRDALAVDPGHRSAAGNLLLTLHYGDRHSPDAVFEEHAAWGESQGATPIATHRPERAQAERRLRIGYVSPDLRMHSVAHFARALVEHRDPDQFEVFCYADVRQPDDYTNLFKERADHWRATPEMSDEDLAALIVQDGIDVLVDLAGHTAGNRLSVFARRPAPVQVTYLGYPDTTGLASMDYRITDGWADPPGQPERTTEALIRLDRPFLCYTPPVWAPAANTLPALTTGHVTFGSFNNLAKLTGAMTELWAELLHALPDSRLVLKTKSFRDPAVTERYRRLFLAHDIAPQRIDLIGWADTPAEHLARYHSIDIALDTAPYNGATTTCEALWMGVPVVTLQGATHAGRVGASLLRAAGLGHCIATSQQEYLQSAIELALDLPGLSALRAGLRAKLAASPLCDGPGFAGSMEKVYRRLWRDWCHGSPSPL